MQFTLLDRIVRFESRGRIVAVKGLSLAEEYLADHFPGNPVMPGVLMLEAMVQAGNYLLRAAKDFSFSLCSVKEASNVKYARFLMPADQLILEVDLLECREAEANFSGRGTIGSDTSVSARWTTRFYNLATQDARMARNDRIIVESEREKFRILGGEKCWNQMVANVS